MFIANFDYLNSPPQLYFLNKRTNKTIIGGSLFLLYIIVISIIFIYYIVNYYLNDKYDISYSFHKTFFDNQNNNDLKDIDPKFNFSINFYKINKELERVELDDKFWVYDIDFSPINNNTFYSKSPKDLKLFIYYYCINNCSLEEDKEDISYEINFTYHGYKIDHQNKIPLKAKSDNYSFHKELYFSLNKTTLFEVDWEIIKYKEEKGLLDLFHNWFNKKTEYIAFDIVSIDKLTTENIINLDFLEIYGLKLLSIIYFNDKNTQYLEYKRTKKSPLDVIANIGSLFSTFLIIFSYIFSLYSSNLNNYQIIKKILSNQKKLKELNIKVVRSKTIKFKINNYGNKTSENFDKLSIDTSKSVPFKSNDNNKITENNGNKNDDNLNIEGVHFIHFLFKQFNCKCRKMKSKIEIINTCNNILFKYISIENILYNQIIFENLLKDYKWNEPNLTRIDSNFSIQKLKLIT